MNLKKAEASQDSWWAPAPKPRLSVATLGGHAAGPAPGGARKLQAELEMAFGPAPEPYVAKWPARVRLLVLVFAAGAPWAAIYAAVRLIAAARPL